MKLSSKTNKELDALKNGILYTEKLISNAKIQLELALEIDDLESNLNKLEKSIEFGYSEIKRNVSIQAESMKLEYNLVLDLIFDRENTLNKLS